MKAVTTKAIKDGQMNIDPFVDFHFHFTPVDRGFLSDDEINRLMTHKFTVRRLEQVRDIFLFSCFSGLSYVDMSQLTPENIVVLDGQQWIITSRKKTNVSSNIPLLDVPRIIIEKYDGILSNGKLLPIISNQKLNAFLKEIAVLCNINKNLTCHLARHTFATMALNKGVPIESVSKMLGHTNIRTTQIYAKITSQKVRNDMELLSSKLGRFKEASANIIGSTEDTKPGIVKSTTQTKRHGKSKTTNRIAAGHKAEQSSDDIFVEPQKKRRGRPRKSVL